MTKANPYADCRRCGSNFLKPVKRAVYCSLKCATEQHIERRGPDDCWEWQGALKPPGYGSMSYNGRHYHPHRAVLSLKLGRDLGPKEETRHACDNPPCCNPAHLIPGSHSDNMKDAFLRGRSNPKPPARRGEQHHRAKLTADAVREIRSSAADAWELAEKFGVQAEAINKVRRGERWSHI